MRRTLVVAGCLILAVACLVIEPWPQLNNDPAAVLSLVALWIAAYYLETRTISLGPAGTFSPAPMLMYVLVLVFGPWAAVPTVLLLLRQWKSTSSRLFNAAQYLIHATAARLAFVLVLGLSRGSLLVQVLAHAAAIVAFIASNLLLVTLLKVASGQAPAAVLWNTYYRPILPIYIDNMVHGAICMLLIGAIGWAGVAATIFLAYSKLLVQVRVVGGAIGKALTAESLISAIDVRDSYTKNHSERVAKYANGIAQAMRLSPGLISDIDVAARLHDIGKIATPDSVLQKIGPLTAEEMAVVREHPEKSQQILAVNSQLSRIAEIAGQHHERFDGRGYPLGLKGNNICLEARIIACADAFDAMTTDRPYRQALSVSEAISELRQNSGTQFDPQVVDALLRHLGVGAWLSWHPEQSPRSMEPQV